MTDDPYAERKNLTFAQAEGFEPLPSQLALGEISQELRALLWACVYDSLEKQVKYSDSFVDGGPYIEGTWLVVLRRKHIFRDHRMADDFKNDYEELRDELKRVFADEPYHKVLDLVQWLLQQSERVVDARLIRAVLAKSRAAYRLLDDDKTIVPITLDEEVNALNQAFSDVAKSEFAGARTHLAAAAKHLTAGNAPASIRESIHAVESVARSLGGEATLGAALKELKARKNLHPALEKGFSSIYGFTNDQAGIRHPLIDDETAKVDEFDAQFMLGACAAFVSYLINRTRDKPVK